MTVHPARRLSWQAAIIMPAVLAVGILFGFTAVAWLYPAPREQALLWDDYIVVTAELYQKEGDIARARERLQKLPTDDPARTVAALAAVYVPEPELGENSAAALRELASALTGRTISPPSDPVTVTASQPAPGPSGVLTPFARSWIPWGGLCIISVAWLGLAVMHERRPAPAEPRRAATGGPIQGSLLPAEAGPTSPAPRVDKVATRRPASKRSAPPAPQTHSPAEAPPLAITLAYQGGSEPFEKVTPLANPTTRRLVACCGLTSGPPAPGTPSGFLGFLVWLHDRDGDGSPQTIGLVSESAQKKRPDAVTEWMAFARLREVTVARPGIVQTLETRHLRAVVSVTDIAFSNVGRQKHTVFSKLSVQLDITFKKRAHRPARHADPTLP